jgi:hypothetical protein
MFDDTVIVSSEERAAELTVAIGLPVRCTHCPEDSAPIAPENYKEHMLHHAHVRVEADLAQQLLEAEATVRRVRQALESAHRLGCTGDGYYTAISNALNATPHRRERKSP